MKKLLGTTTVINEATATAKIRPFWKITGIFFLVFLCGTFAGVFVQMPATVIYYFIEVVKHGTEIDINYVPDWLTAVGLYSTITTIAAAIIYCNFFERRRVFTLGFIKKGAVLEYIIGLLAGLVLFSGAYVFLILTKQVEFKGINPEMSIEMIVLFFFGFVIQGASEEILMRGYYFVSVASTGKVALALFSSSAIFSLLHIFNNGIHILPAINLFLFGILAALYFLRRGSIWGVAALHTIWNFAQGNLYGCEVSGIKMGSSIYISEKIGNNLILSGGNFGPEGSIGVTIVLTLGIVILLFMKNKKVEVTIK